MEKNVIITISRQFGSNGREIARKLAEYLDISYYNKEILERNANNDEVRNYCILLNEVVSILNKYRK